MWWQMLILHIIHLQIILILIGALTVQDITTLIRMIMKKNMCVDIQGVNIFLYAHTCLWKSAVAPLKINISERFKNIDFKNNYWFFWVIFCYRLYT